MGFVPVSQTEESSIHAAVDDLYRAVGGLADPAKEFVGGQVRQAPSLYETLVAEIAATSSGDTYSRGVGRSVPVVWCDALDLRVEVDSRTKSFQPEGDSTPDRLRAVAARRWRPQDVRQVRDIAAEVSSWSVSIRALIEPAHVKTIAAPCPNCDRAHVYRQHAGETVRQPALQLVAETGCTCLACRAFWPPERYLFLCKLLNFDLPEGVVA